MMQNCDLGLENATLGLRSQFFTIQTSQPANNICILSHRRSTTVSRDRVLEIPSLMIVSADRGDHS